MKESKAIAELISMPKKHQQSMKSIPQRIQDHALDVVDPTSKTDTQIYLFDLNFYRLLFLFHNASGCLNTAHKANIENYKQIQGSRKNI